jgi:hypothetical protein
VFGIGGFVSSLAIVQQGEVLADLQIGLRGLTGQEGGVLKDFQPMRWAVDGHIAEREAIDGGDHHRL